MLLLEDKIQSILADIDLTEGEEFNELSPCPCRNPRKISQIAQFGTGASKWVFIPFGCAWVLKIPFRGEKSYDYDDYTDEGTVRFNVFSGAGDCEWNYCELEAVNYDNAVDEGLDKYFAKTFYYGTTKGGYPVYIQEKCSYTCPTGSRPSEASYSKAEKYEKSLECCIEDVKWAAAFIERYGEEEYERLNDFLYSLEGLNDLTYRNIGFNMQGLPVLIDFSGFND